MDVIKFVVLMLVLGVGIFVACTVWSCSYVCPVIPSLPGCSATVTPTVSGVIPTP